MGINFTAIVLITFAIGSALAAIAGVMNGLYYNEVNFDTGLYLGVVRIQAQIHQRQFQRLCEFRLQHHQGQRRRIETST
jgi:Branched-chain amino acid transport system / permease component